LGRGAPGNIEYVGQNMHQVIIFIEMVETVKREKTGPSMIARVRAKKD
jgi:hypothetical protein